MKEDKYSEYRIVDYSPEICKMDEDDNCVFINPRAFLHGTDLVVPDQVRMPDGTIRHDVWFVYATLARTFRNNKERIRMFVGKAIVYIIDDYYEGWLSHEELYLNFDFPGLSEIILYGEMSLKYSDATITEEHGLLYNEGDVLVVPSSNEYVETLPEDSPERQEQCKYWEKPDKVFVASLLAKAWSVYNTTLIESILDEHVEYRSCAVCNVMKGRSAYIDYLKGKFSTLRENHIWANTTALELEGDDACVKIEDASGENPPSILVFEMKDGLITNMLMRPEVMYDLEDLNDPTMHDTIIQQIVEKVKHGITNLAVVAGYKAEDVRWLQSYPYLYTPQFQHLCFRLYSSVYSLRIVIYDMYNRDVEVPNATEAAQLDVCRENDLIPCLVGIDINALNEPTLVSATTHEPIELLQTSKDGKGKMSDWELNNAAVWHTLNYLVSKGCSDFSFTDAPGFMPQIRFMYDGQMCYAYVYGHAVGNKDIPPINKSFLKSVDGCRGFFVEVGVSTVWNNGDFNETEIFRGPVYMGDNSEGYELLMPIEEALDKYGAIETEVYNIE